MVDRGSPMPPAPTGHADGPAGAGGRRRKAASATPLPWRPAPEDAERMTTPPTPPRGSALEVLAASTRLGLTSFGGPVAHLGYFRDEYVVRRKWLDEHAYADLVALCQFLPGPASSQVGIALRLSRGGIPGALAAFRGFTLPSAIESVLA